MIVRLVVRRLLFLVFVLFGLSLVTFSLSHIVPSNPARLIAGPRASASAVESVRRQWGFDRPLPVQYVEYVKGVTRLDFGRSITSRQPVRDDLQRYLPATLELGFFAFLLSALVGIPLGILAAIRRDTWVDHISRLVSISGLALPVFWLALSAQFFFYGKLGWFPAGERLPFGVDPSQTITSLYVLDALLTGQWALAVTAAKHLALPTIVLAYGSLAVVTRMVRAGMLEVLGQDFIRTARAKGLAHSRVVLGHAVKNAMLPIVTTLGLQVGLLFSGAFLVEIVFSWPGIGRYAVLGIQQLDYNAIMATTLTIALIFVLMNLVVDILYLFLDPRISFR